MAYPLYEGSVRSGLHSTRHELVPGRGRTGKISNTLYESAYSTKCSSIAYAEFVRVARPLQQVTSYGASLARMNGW